MAKKQNRIWTEQETAIVRRAAMMNMPHETIAKLLKTRKETLEAQFADILDTASEQANAAVLGALYKNAIGGNVAAQIFWCKTRLGMQEKSRLELSGELNVPKVAVIVDG